ncbi:hypothetical protein SAMN05216474_3080 [Lishizhenia tianjinensis]|uniref:Outer membrane protein beta-barrel domain-containing protein n=1 Tax=Lishizhenia tianjinensis TaxID=477690 RepID=A0A1I7BUA2_9FLAO|nr:hypothetical protein [Lishizhenia tianjinensis]SFT90691.1 hypothetical protein SAMN05216474_3080 [Lishizhenia tianjinensis]
MKIYRTLLLLLLVGISTLSNAQLLSSGWQRNNNFLDFEIEDGYVAAGGLGYTYAHKIFCRTYLGVRGGFFVHDKDAYPGDYGTPFSTSLDAVAFFHILGPLNIQVNYGRYRHNFLKESNIAFSSPAMRLQIEANVILGRKVMLKYGYNFFGNLKEIRENDWPYKAFVGVGIRL